MLRVQGFRGIGDVRFRELAFFEAIPAFRLWDLGCCVHFARCGKSLCA